MPHVGARGGGGRVERRTVASAFTRPACALKSTRVSKRMPGQRSDASSTLASWLSVEEAQSDGRHPLRHAGASNEQAGRVNADATVLALHASAAAAGADVRHQTRATHIEVVDDGRVRVASVTDAGVTEVFEARTAVVTVGAWTHEAPRRRVTMPRLVVTQEQPAHFAVRDGAIGVAELQPLPGRDGRGLDYWRSPCTACSRRARA